MSITVKIPFEDPSQHLFDTSLVEVLNGVGKMKSIADANELFYFDFANDGSLAARRGGLSLTLPDKDAANLNTGSVSGGYLNLLNKDFSYAAIPQVANPNPLEVSARVNFSFLTTWTAHHKVFVIKGVGNSRIELKAQLFSGTFYRLYFMLFDTTGARVLIASVFGNFNIPQNDREISFSLNANECRIFVDGALFSTRSLSAFTFDFTNITSFLGAEDPDLSNSKIKSFQVIGKHSMTGSTTSVGEQFTFSKVENGIITVAPMLMDKFVLFSREQLLLDESEVMHQLMLNSQYWWFNTASNKWEEVVAPGQFNTSLEMTNNVDKLELVGGVGKYVQIVTFLKSLDGFITPEIRTIDISYRFYFGLGAGLPSCIVYGGIVDSSGDSVSGAKITVWGKDFIHGDSYVTRNSEYVTNLNGKWDIEIVETASILKTVNISIEYTDKDGKVVKNDFKNLIIPNVTSKSFSQLLIDNNVSI